VAAAAAPIGFDTALPVAREQTILRVMAVAAEAELDGDRLRAQGARFALAYGAHPRLALFAGLPFAEKRLSAATGTRSASGLGDLQLAARWTAWQEDTPGQTRRLAPLIRVTAPTGSDDRRDAEGTLPPPLQPGGGFWRAGAGLIGTWQTLDWQFDVQLVHERGFRDDGRRPGDLWRADGSFQQVLARIGEAGVPAFVYGVLEAGVQREARMRGGPAETGGTWSWIAPGLQWVTRRVVVEGQFEAPVNTSLRRQAPDPDWTVRGGVRVSF
jgi:hypothetical protein